MPERLATLLDRPPHSPTIPILQLWGFSVLAGQHHPPATWLPPANRTPTPPSYPQGHSAPSINSSPPTKQTPTPQTHRLQSSDTPPIETPTHHVTRLAHHTT